MKKLVLGMAVATGLVVMAGQSSAKALTTCEMEQAILEAKTVMGEVGGMRSTLSDAKGVSISEHVKYLQDLVTKAQSAVDNGYAKYPDELYAAVAEGAQALRLITGQAQEGAKQGVTTATSEAQTLGVQTTKAVARVAEQTEVSESKAPKAEAKEVAAAEKSPEATKMTGVKLAVAKIETVKTIGGAELASVGVQTTVAAPEEMAGLDTEMKVPATGEVETWELEKLLMTIGVASAVGMLVLAGICALIGRR